MSFENSQRQQENSTASFRYPEMAQQAMNRQSLSPIQERSEDELPQSHSIIMPQPLIQNSKPNKQEHQFSPQERLKSSQLNMTFRPQLYKIDMYSSKQLIKLKEDNSRLQLHMIGMNQMINEMLANKNQVLNEYQSIIMQKKGYKKLMKNLNEQYEAYLTMLQGDYQIKLDQQLQRESKRFTSLRKEVQTLNTELSKPLIKNTYQNDLKIQKLEKEIFEGKIYLQKMKDANEKKREKMNEMEVKIRQKEKDLKKMDLKITKYEEECDDEQLIPKHQQQAMSKQYQELMTRFQRINKIIEFDLKKNDIETNRKRKAIKQKGIVIRNMQRQIKDYETKIKDQQSFLQQNAQKQNKAQTHQKLSVPSLYRSQANQRQSHISRDIFVSTPKTHSDMVGHKFQQQGPNLPIKLYESYNSKRIANNAHREKTEQYRTITEEGNQHSSRLQLNLRKKRIYTELEKNHYFKKIENNQQIKISRLIDNHEPPFGTLRQLQNEPSRQIKLKTKLPQISSKFSRPIETAPQHDPQILLNQSIIDQIKINSIQLSHKQPKRSIQLHNLHMKQIRANKKKLNIANYEQLCRALKRQKLLIEEDCSYELGDLIYNSRY